MLENSKKLSLTAKIILGTIGLGIGLGLIALGLFGVQLSHILWGE